MRKHDEKIWWCIGFPLLHNKLPQKFGGLNSYYLTVSVGQGSLWPGSLSQGLAQGAIRLLARLWSQLKVQVGSPLMWLLAGFHSPQLLSWGPQFLASCWPEAPRSSLPQGSPVRQLTTRQLVSSEQAGEGALATQKSASEPLISEVTPHHLLPHSIHEKWVEVQPTHTGRGLHKAV